MLRHLLPLLLSTIAIAQDAAERCAAALLRGDTEAAAIAATSATDPAERERLQAALLPASRRAAAMLAVAARYPTSQQADFAILAGAAAMLVLRDNGAALPGLAAWHDFENGDDDWGVLATSVMEGLWRQLEQRRAAGGDLTILAEAEQALLRCSVSRYGFDPARVAPSASWTLPGRREPLLLRAWRRQPGRIGWHDVIASGPADRELQLDVNRQTAIEGLPSGDWLVELSSITTRWRGVRAVEVSDLDVITLTDRNWIALAAWRNQQPVRNTTWWLRKEGQPHASGTSAGAATMLSNDAFGNGGELFVSGHKQRARVPLPGAYADKHVLVRWHAHVMVDRPIFKAGENVQGRIVLQQTRYDGASVDAVAHSSPAANQRLELRAFTGSNELRLPGRTDEHGVWSFDVAIPETFKSGDVEFTVHLPDESVRVYEGAPCRVADFRRAALLLDTEGATHVEHGMDTSAALRATWASGAPASGLLVDAKVTVWPNNQSSYSELHKLATDATGRANLKLPLKSLAATWVRIEFQVETPAGTKKLRHSINARKPQTRSDDRSWIDRYGPRLRTPRIAVVGQPLEVRVLGAANDTVLFVAGRGRGARPQSLQLDEHGQAVVTVTPTRAEWPALDLAVAGQAHAQQRRVPMLLRAVKQPEIQLPKSTTPASQVACRVATGMPGTIVTMSAVDERIFTIAKDRTREPNETLRPSAAKPMWRHAASAKELTPEELLAPLLEHGRIPSSGLHGDVDPNTGAAGAGAAATAGAGSVRTDFRATASFQTAVAGADGVATFDLKLPDDLTTWRVALLGIAPDGVGFQERRHIETRIPLAAEPVLPRVLRVGDTVDVPIVVDRKTETGNDGTVNLSAACVNAAATIDNGEHAVQVAGGGAVSAMVTMHGIAAGETKIALAANVGDFEDRSLRLLPVHEDAVLRPASAAAMALGNVSVATPTGTSGDLQVTVLGGSSATWAALDRRLSTYPYGCVEQTLAKLLPFFAAVRGAKVHNTAPPTASKEFSKRLRAGLRRMRQLQASHGGAFSFWPGGAVDLDMTVLVLHGLAVMREGGLDPARFGLACDLQREPFIRAIDDVNARSGRATTALQRLQIELASAALRMHPTAGKARTAVVQAISNKQDLPDGLLLRAGLALAAAGETQHAESCLARVTSKRGTAQNASSLPSENGLAVRALELELQCVLHPTSDHAALATEVLLEGLNGYSTTYAQACALSASALAIPRHNAKQFTVQLDCGGEPRQLTLSQKNGFTARVRVPSTERCSVSGPSAQQLILRTAGHRHEPGSKHRAWSNPLVVERDLCRRAVNATKKQRRKNQDLVAIADNALVAGEVVWLRLRVSTQRMMRYVVLECPLPAGFEPVEDLSWLERFDDRIAVSCNWVDSTPTEFLIPLVPTLVGTMVWPPTTAAPMYANGRDGGTAGAKLTVKAAAASTNRATEVVCFKNRPAPAKPKVYVETARHRVDNAMWQLRRAFEGDEDDKPLTPLPTALANAIKACSELRGDDGEPDYVLDELTETIATWRDDLEDYSIHDPLHAARTETLLTLVSMHRDYVAQAMHVFESDRTGEYDHYYIDTLVEALLLWPDRESREPLLAKVLTLALARNEVPKHVLEEFEGPIEDDDLRSILMTMLATHPDTFGEEILELLPREDLRATAPNVLLQAAEDDWPRWLVEMLSASPVGRIELARSLQDPETLARHAEVVVTVLPQAYWHAQPLATFELLARKDIEGFSLIASLAASSNTTDEMQRELVRVNDVDWQATLAKALLHRGVRDLGNAAASASEASYALVWQQALRLPLDSASDALQLLKEVEDDIGSGPLEAFLRTHILRTGSAKQLAYILPNLADDRVTEVLARLAPTTTQELLRTVTEPFSPLPIPRTTADCAALWAYAARLEDYDGVLAACCRTEPALQFAANHIAAIADEDLRENLQYELADLRQLDPDTGRAYPDEPWQPILQSVAHRGVPTTWTASQRQRYDHLRQLRGVR